MQPSRRTGSLVQRVEDTTQDVAARVETLQGQTQEITTTVQSLYERVTTENPTIMLVSIGVLGGSLIARSTNNRVRRNQRVHNNGIGEIVNGVLAIASGIGLGFLNGRMLNL